MADAVRARIQASSSRRQVAPVGAGRTACARAARGQAFGQPVNTYYNLANAKVIVSLDSDFLASGPASLRYAREFAARRRVRGRQTDHEPAVRGRADPHRHGLQGRPPAAAARRATSRSSPGRWPPRSASPTARKQRRQSRHLQMDRPHRARPAAQQGRLPGDRGRIPAAHRARPGARHERDASATSARRCSTPTPSKPTRWIRWLRFSDLVKDLDAGARGTVAHPRRQSRPSPLRWNWACATASRRRACASTSACTRTRLREVCQWHLPEAHYLEAWGDARAFDGTVTIQQPLIQPLYNGRSAMRRCCRCSPTGPTLPRYEIVRGYWRGAAHRRRISKPGGGVGPRWRGAGYRASGQDPGRARRGHHRAVPRSSASNGKLEVIFRPDPTIYDGRFANNGWLQELPKPITKLTWDNAAIISPATAHRFNVDNRRHGEAHLSGPHAARAGVGPARPGQRRRTLHLGYGRTARRPRGNGMGFNPYGLRTSTALWHDTGLERAKDVRLLPLRHHPEQSHPRHAPPHHPQGRYRGVPQGSGIACTRAPKLRPAN